MTVFFPTDPQWFFFLALLKIRETKLSSLNADVAITSLMIGKAFFVKVTHRFAALPRLILAIRNIGINLTFEHCLDVLTELQLE